MMYKHHGVWKELDTGIYPEEPMDKKYGLSSLIQKRYDELKKKDPKFKKFLEAGDKWVSGRGFANSLWKGFRMGYR